MAGKATACCGFSLILLSGFLAACVSSGTGEAPVIDTAATTSVASPANFSKEKNGAAGQAAPVGTNPAAVAAPAAAAPGDLYSGVPAKMRPVDCGQCHPRPYGDLRANGGRHKFDCQDCHQTIHAYSPIKNNFADLMPKCGSCHQPPHGTKQVNCLACHNPHAPAKSVDLARVKDVCADCHDPEFRQLEEFPSKHTQQGCATCHYERHGYIPACFECHQPHFSNQPGAECQSCHPVHQPLQISFTPETKPELCQDCHSGIYGKWVNTASKHRQVNCTRCHRQHGQIPQCTACHQAPHSEKQMAMFPRCLDCHLDVHDLPVKRR